MDLNIWTAAGLGLVVGILIGALLDDMFDALREAFAARGRNVRLRMPSQLTLIAVGMGIVLVVNAILGVALISQRARSDAFAQCLVSSAQSQRALDAIIFAVASQDEHKMNDAIKGYVALRSRPSSELCGVRR